MVGFHCDIIMAINPYTQKQYVEYERRSKRLAAKPRVNYNVDEAFERMLNEDPAEEKQDVVYSEGQIKDEMAEEKLEEIEDIPYPEECELAKFIEHQKKDDRINQLRMEAKSEPTESERKGFKLNHQDVLFQNTPNGWLPALPQSVATKVAHYFHMAHFLNHQGIHRTEGAIKAHFAAPKIRKYSKQPLKDVKRAINTVPSHLGPTWD